MVPRRIFRGMAIAGGGLAVVLVALAFVEFDSPRLGKAVLEKAGAATGARVTAEGFRLGLLRGLALEKVQAASAFAGGRFELTLDRLVFEHRLLPLLAGRVAVKRVVLRRPRLSLVETGGAAGKGARVKAPGAGSAPAVAFDVSRIAVEDGAIELRAKGEPKPVTVAGLDLELRDLRLDPKPGAGFGGLSGVGRIEIEEIALAETRVRDVEGRMTIAGGRVETEGVRFRTDEGRFEAKLTARLDRLPFTYTLALQGDPLDVNAMAGASGGGFGPGWLDLQAEGVGAEPEGLQGNGVFKLAEGRLPSTPLLAALEGALGKTRLVGARYKASDTPFRMAKGRVHFEGFRLDTEQVGLDASGWVAAAGPMDVRLGVRTPREGLTIPAVSTDVLDALTDEQGWVRIPFKVTGTQAKPKVLPDLAALGSQAAKGGVTALVKRGVGSLFGKKKDEP